MHTPQKGGLCHSVRNRASQQPHGTGARAPPLDRGAPSLCPSCALPCPGDPVQGVERQGERLNGPLPESVPAALPGTRGQRALGSEAGMAPGPSLASSSTHGMLRLWKQEATAKAHVVGGPGRRRAPGLFRWSSCEPPFPNFPAIPSYSASLLSGPTWQGQVAG